MKRFLGVEALAIVRTMRSTVESVRSAGASLMVVGFFMLFFSVAFIAVSPESEHSAFPYPLGVPGIAVIVIGLVLYLVARHSGAHEKEQSPPS